VYPSKGTYIQDEDLDRTQDRINDITYGDRNSDYDENVVNKATDYAEIIKGMRHIARRRFRDKFVIFEKDFESFLETTDAKSKSNIHGGGKRKLKDLLNLHLSYLM
jgi:hypothetical protein